MSEFPTNHSTRSYRRENARGFGKISHQMALNKSIDEYEKYKEQQRIMEHEQSLKEIEEDIKKLKPVK
jgi:hypothetical protein